MSAPDLTPESLAELERLEVEARRAWWGGFTSAPAVGRWNTCTLGRQGHPAIGELLKAARERDELRAQVAEMRAEDELWKANAPDLRALLQAKSLKLGETVAALSAAKMEVAELRARAEKAEADLKKLRGDWKDVPAHNRLISIAEWQRIVIARDASISRLMDKLDAERARAEKAEARAKELEAGS